MIKHNLSSKRLKKQLLSINTLIESYFNNLRQFILDFKKSKITKYNKAFLTIGVIFILTLSYFSIPSFFNKKIIEAELENQILKRYNFSIKFNNDVNYSIFPRPNFFTKNLSILFNGSEIANVENFKVLIATDKFFNINKIELKDLIFNKTEFNLRLEDLIFFKNLIQTEPNENNILFKDSDIFFKNFDDETLFLNKISSAEFKYDPINLENVLNSKNEIFNIPYKLSIKNNKFDKEIYVYFNSKKIRLTIKNTTSYENKDRVGDINFLLINKSTDLNYKLKSNSLDFSSKNKKNLYNGLIEFKPFYFSMNFNYDGLSFKNFFNDNSFFVDLIKSEIFNNKNLNAKIDLNVADITNIDELNDLYLKLNINQGNIGFIDSSIMWKDDLKITINESLVNYDKSQINLVGKILLDFDNVDDFYKSFQIPKNDRKSINKIELDFVYNLDQKKITFDNVKVDNKSNSNLDEFINDFNVAERSFNKITFKKFISNFFSNYAG